MNAMKAAFWLSAGMLVYTYLVYPVLLAVLAKLFGRREESPPRRVEMPAVSLVFAAHNEEAVIAEKMQNCAAIDYPQEKLEILVGCDCCSDRTVQIAEAAALSNARVFDFRERSGKPMVLNRLVPRARGEIVVFCDANIIFAPDAIRLLMRPFADPRIGCACGEVKFRTASGGPSAESSYWRYECFLKRMESRLDALVGASGAFFAVRRDLYEPLPPQGIIDDFLIAMRVRDAGYRLIYEVAALAFEETAASVRDEFHRRVRIGAGNFHALRFTWRQLLPSAGSAAFAYWSHKVFRWLAPFALLLLAASSLALSAGPFYAACAALILAFALSGLLGYLLELRNVRRSVFSMPYYFLSMNLALLLGFFRFATRAQSLAWRRTAR